MIEHKCAVCNKSIEFHTYADAVVCLKALAANEPARKCFGEMMAEEAARQQENIERYDETRNDDNYHAGEP